MNWWCNSMHAFETSKPRRSTLLLNRAHRGRGAHGRGEKVLRSGSRPTRAQSTPPGPASLSLVRGMLRSRRQERQPQPLLQRGRRCKQRENIRELAQRQHLEQVRSGSRYAAILRQEVGGVCSSVDRVEFSLVLSTRFVVSRARRLPRAMSQDLLTKLYAAPQCAHVRSRS